MDENYLAADRGQTNKDPVNPFVHHLELTTTYEKIKVSVLFICRSMTFYFVTTVIVDASP